MGGKKPIGEHPSRGHLQRRFTTASRRGGHHRPHIDGGTEETEVTPVMQEFSLFSQFDSSPNRFGILNPCDTKSDADDHKMETMQDLLGAAHAEEEKVLGYNIMSEIHSLQCNMSTLMAAFERLHYDFYMSANHAYLYGMCQQPNPDSPTPPGIPGMEYHQATSSTIPNDPLASDSQPMKKINERLSTLEGRQKAIQSKISQLDTLYGPNSATWAKTIKRIVSTQPDRDTSVPMWTAVGNSQESIGEVDQHSASGDIVTRPPNPPLADAIDATPLLSQDTPEPDKCQHTETEKSTLAELLVKRGPGSTSTNARDSGTGKSADGAKGQRGRGERISSSAPP